MPRFRMPGSILLRALRWGDRHLGGIYAAVGVLLSLGLLVILLGFFLLVRAWREIRPSGVAELDEAVLGWFRGIHGSRLDALALEVTALASTPVMWMTVLIASVFLWLTRHRDSALLLWAAVIGGTLLSEALKLLFDRGRPDVFAWRIPHVGSPSFPSGHAVTAVVLYGTLAYLVGRLEPSPALRRATWGFAGGVAVLVGATRLYLGVHYPSDVLAGYAAGILWTSFCALVIEAIAHLRITSGTGTRR